MDETLSYGIGAGAGVVEYYLAKRFAPTRPNLAAGVVGVATLLASMFNVVPAEYKPLATANGFTLIAISGMNAITNPSAMGVVSFVPNRR
jgi:hypothetical protein